MLQKQVSRKYENNKEGNRYHKTVNIVKLEKKIRLLHRRLANIKRKLCTPNNDRDSEKQIKAIAEQNLYRF